MISIRSGSSVQSNRRVRAVGPLQIELVPGAALTPAMSGAIVALCAEAYEEPMDSVVTDFAGATHVLGSLNGGLASHAMWVPRRLRCGDSVCNTAYVEAVATRPAHQGKGYASAVLRELASQITDFDIGVLSPSDPAFYARLGWETWRGPLAIVSDDGSLTPTPDEMVMILRLPHSPDLDLDATLVAEWRPGEVW